MMDLVAQCQSIIRAAWTEVVGAPGLTDDEWTQSTLPMRLAGLGIKDPMAILPAARVAACLTFITRARELDLPPETCKLPSDWSHHVDSLRSLLGGGFSPLEEWSARGVRLSSLTDDYWSHKIHQARASKLDRRLALRDRVQFNLQKMPGTTSWMTVVPN